MGAVRAVLAEAGLVDKDYAGHSFRIGVATTVASQGLQDSLIKTLGRWESSAYQCTSKHRLKLYAEWPGNSG